MNVTIVGAGLMGRGMAQSFAQAGHDVLLVDRTRDLLDRAVQVIRLSLATLVEYGSVRPADVEDIVARILPTTDMAEGVREARFVAEVVPEIPDLKKAVILALDRHCRSDTVIASNTSGLDVFGIVAAEMTRPERLVAAHWYAPAHIIPLVEVAPGPKTSRETVSFTANLLAGVGKVPVVMKKFAPGFVVNKIQHGFARAMFELLESNVVEIEEIDKAMKYVLGVRLPIVGIVQSMDFNGLDLVQKICASLQIEVPAIADKVAAGQLGVSTGRGMYDYRGRSEEEILKKRDLRYLRLLAFLQSLDAFEPV
jgi:3-hydroxybutyryl-CoA dehydrogenase